MASVEINECASSSSPCEHSCTNTDGSFQCSCNNGYLLDDDGRSCDGMFMYLVMENMCYSIWNIITIGLQLAN